MNATDRPSKSKSLLIVIAAIVMAAALAFGAYVALRPAVQQSSPGAAGQTETVVVPIEGMTCAACVARVKRTLGGESGIHRVEVDLQKRTATIQYDPERTHPDKTVAAINDLGYKAGTPARIEASP